MTELDPRVIEALERVASSNERLAAANERIIELAVEERSVDSILSGEHLYDAPVCPHCGAINPDTQSNGGEGKLSEFVLVTPCGSCGEIFYAVPIGYRIFDNRDQARDILKGGNE